jgi:hypothetical protein
MAAALLSFLRSLLPRSAGNPLPTMHSLHARARWATGCPPCASFPAKPLRVVRSRSGLAISGRMADVCAELERLADLEEPQMFAAAAPAR